MAKKPQTAPETPARKFYPDPGKSKAEGADNAAPKQSPPAGEDSAKPDPTRFGDWEIKGRCIDF